MIPTIDEMVTRITFANWGMSGSEKGAILKEYIEQIIDHIGVSIAMCDVVHTPEDWQIIKSKLLEIKEQIQ